MKRVFMIGVIFLFIGVTAAIAADTKTDYDHSVDFRKFHTFAWRTAKPDGNGVVNNSLVMSRIQEAIGEQLTSKGLTQATNNPDLYVVAHVGTKNMQDIDYWPTGWRHWRWMGPHVTVQRYVEGTVIVDLVEAKSNRLVWHAVTTDTGDDLLDVQSAKKVDKMVVDSFKHYPPETRATTR